MVKNDALYSAYKECSSPNDVIHNKIMHTSREFIFYIHQSENSHFLPYFHFYIFLSRCYVLSSLLNNHLTSAII